MFKKLFIFFFSSFLMAGNLTNMEMLGLDENKNVQEQIKEKSILVEDFYVGMDMGDFQKKFNNNQIRKVTNPCEFGLCGTNSILHSYYILNYTLFFQQYEYTPFFLFKNEKLYSIELIRKIERKKYGLDKNRVNTLFGYFAEQTNLLKDKDNTKFVLNHCFDGTHYIQDGQVNSINEFNFKCEQLFRNYLKHRTFIIEKEYQQLSFINNKEGLDTMSLFNKIGNKELAYPFENKYTHIISCSGFGYCMEELKIKNTFKEFFDNNFMVYQNTVLNKDETIIQSMRNERNKIHCNDRFNEEGISKDEFENRMVCKKRIKIFDDNIVYVLKVDHFNKDHIDFSNLLVPKDISKIIKEKTNKLENLKEQLTSLERKELEMEVKEYTYLLSLMNVEDPVYNGNFPDDDETIFLKNYDLDVVNSQIEQSKRNLEIAKTAKIQYQMDDAYTQMKILEKIRKFRF